MKNKRVVGAAIFCGLTSFILIGLSFNTYYQHFRDGLLGEFFDEEWWILIGPIFTTTLGTLTARASDNLVRKRLAISATLITGLLTWILAGSSFIAILVLFPALCVAGFVWTYEVQIDGIRE